MTTARFPGGRGRGLIAAAAMGTVALLGAAACGGTTSAASASDPRAAFDTCLRQHGVTPPTPSPRPSGGFGGGGGGRSFFTDPQMRQAFQACRSLLPGGGFGGGFGRGLNSSALAAFRSCMLQHGVTLPTTGRGTGLRSLRTADPTVVKALSVCRVLLPSGRPTPVASG